MIDTRKIRRMNLNRLPILWEVLRCRNLSNAAENLGLTQSTISTVLKGLREWFDDELLVPSGREMVLTERAQELLPILQATLELLGDVLWAPCFDPALDSGTFRISTADYISMLILPRLAEKFSTDAPSLTLHVFPPSKSAMRDLKMGVTDLLIGPEQLVDWIGARQEESYYKFEHCFDDSLVCIAREGTDISKIDHDTYLNTPHASIFLQRELPASIEYDSLISRRLVQNNRIFVPEFSLLPLLVQHSEMISLVPRSVAELYSSMTRITIFDPPVAFPDLKLVLLWVRGREKDARFGWFLNEIRTAFRR
jgi:LysR family transcriptional regulator, nod-box dependent transcriptional activator